MNVSKLGEFGLINLIKKIVPVSKDVVKGIGDDTAVLPLTKKSYLLFTTDMFAEDVHFTRKDKACLIGHKALACNISDIVSMGGMPTHALVSLGLPKTCSIDFVKELYQGLGQLARQFGVSIVGGDTIKSEKTIINVALLGEVKRKNLVTRAGAEAGDIIFVSGPLGGSLSSGRHLTFTPRLAQAQFLVNQFKPTSMMDISDGLGGDLNHILEQSKVGAKLWEEAIPRNKNVTLNQAMNDGEDFELLFTLSPRTAKRLQDWQERQKAFYFYPIGQITSNRKQRQNGKSFTHF